MRALALLAALFAGAAADMGFSVRVRERGVTDWRAVDPKPLNTMLTNFFVTPEDPADPLWAEAELFVSLARLGDNEVVFESPLTLPPDWGQPFHVNLATRTARTWWALSVFALRRGSGEQLSTSETVFVTEPGEPRWLGADDPACPDVDAAARPGPEAFDGVQVDMPPALCTAFTMDRRVPVSKFVTALEQHDTDHAPSVIDDYVKLVEQRATFYYGDTDTWLYDALDDFPLAGQDVLIVGSTYPWYEAICIARGARSVTTLDYNRLEYQHPLVTTVTVDEFHARPAAQQQFPVVLSISSVEHDGLGRYNDPIRPDGDLRAMRLHWRYVQPGGTMFFSVPFGVDEVVWNANRVYGPLRLPLLFQHFDLQAIYGATRRDTLERRGMHSPQPVFVARPHELELELAPAAGGGGAAAQSFSYGVAADPLEAAAAICRLSGLCASQAEVAAVADAVRAEQEAVLGGPFRPNEAVTAALALLPDGAGV